MLATFPLDARSSNPPPGSRSGLFPRLLFPLALALWVVASRIPYLNHFEMLGKDGPLYINSLKLDSSYDVPMPGNIGYVLLGKLAGLCFADPVTAFLAVNVALTVLGVVFTYLFAALFVARPLAAALAFAMSCNALVWYHGAIIASYPVWLATLPAVGWFGVRYGRDRKLADLLGASLALGAGMVCRPDLLVFGGPLWFGCLALGRAPWRHWLLGAAVVGLACACWFFGTAWVLGGIGVYLDRVREKHEFDRAGFSFFARGMVEGLLRNGVKYSLFLAWGASVALIPFGWGLFRGLTTLRDHWREGLLAILWAGPSVGFSFLVFAGNAGLIFPLLPLLYLAAALGLHDLLGRRNPRRAVAAMLLVGMASLAQFVAVPLRPERNQRDVILNVMFLRYSGAGILSRYNFNLDDYGVSPALASVTRQMRSPEALPAREEVLRR